MPYTAFGRGSPRWHALHGLRPYRVRWLSGCLETCAGYGVVYHSYYTNSAAPVGRRAPANWPVPSCVYKKDVVYYKHKIILLRRA